MATTFYERHNPRHRAWSKGHVPAIREAIKDAVSVARRMNLSRLPDESDPDPEAGYVMGERLGVADELPIPTHPAPRRAGVARGGWRGNAMPRYTFTDNQYAASCSS